MNKNLRYVGIATLVFLVIVPLAYYAMFDDPHFSVAVMLEIAVIGFFTVIFLMVIGLIQDHYPKEAKDSAAVAVWSQRAGIAPAEEVVAETADEA